MKIFPRKGTNMTSANCKILVCYHKPASLIRSDIFLPLHCGRAVASLPDKDGLLDATGRAWLEKNCLGDNTGDNISLLNRKYCELTAHYWAWKNYEKLGNPEYIGFMHYCRLFIFNHYEGQKNRRMLSTLTSQIFDHYCNLGSFELSDHDMIIPMWLESFKFTVSEKGYGWDRIPPLQCKVSERNPRNIGLKEALSYIHEKYSAYEQDAKEYLNGSWCLQWNMFIFKKELFFEYAGFIFDVLNHVDRQINDEHFCVADSRYLGYLGEHLTGIFIRHKIKQGITYKQLPMLQIVNNPLPYPLVPLSLANAVVITCSVDDSSVFQASVLVKSIINTAKNEYNYEIVILETKLSQQNKDRLLLLQAGKNNIYIRFFDIRRALLESSGHHSLEENERIYFKLALPVVFERYERFIYVDTRSVVLDDIANLYNSNLESNWIAACRDLVTVSRVNKGDLELEYFSHNLGINDPYHEYISDAVIVFNMNAIRRAKATNQILKANTNTEDQKKFVECDLLNRVFRGHIKRIDTSWNVCPQWSTLPYLPQKDYIELRENLKSPKLICFRGTKSKPWNNPGLDLGYRWWSVARGCAFYEEMLFKYQKEKISAAFRNISQLENARKRLKRVKLYILLSWGKRRERYKHQKVQLKKKIIEIEKICNTGKL